MIDVHPEELTSELAALRKELATITNPETNPFRDTTFMQRYVDDLHIRIHLLERDLDH